MDLSQLELHDAHLLGVTLDAGARTAEIRLAYYAGEQASARTLASLRFSGVSQFNQIADLERLADHASAGNVIQWMQAERSGATCLHLVGGLIAVTATSVELVAS